MARPNGPEKAEIWLPIAGYVGIYEVSNAGRVRAVVPYRSADGILHGDVDRYGYRRVLLSKNGARRRHKVHRLVCSAFYGEAPDGTECGHRDGDSQNNSAENLGWISRLENIDDARRHGTYVLNDAARVKRFRKLTAAQVAQIRDGASCGVSERALARKYNVSHGYVHKLISGLRRQGDSINA